jgi:AraC family transcriptional activator of mtrCDE
LVRDDAGLRHRSKIERFTAAALNSHAPAGHAQGKPYDQPRITPAALRQLMIAEAVSARLGAMMLMDRLFDALSKHALRQCLADGAVQPGLLTAISDPYLGPVLLDGSRARRYDPFLARGVRAPLSAVGGRDADGVGHRPAHATDAVDAGRTRRQRGRGGAIAEYATEVAFSHAFRRIHVRSAGATRSS